MWAFVFTLLIMDIPQGLPPVRHNKQMGTTSSSMRPSQQQAQHDGKEEERRREGEGDSQRTWVHSLHCLIGWSLHICCIFCISVFMSGSLHGIHEAIAAHSVTVKGGQYTLYGL